MTAKSESPVVNLPLPQKKRTPTVAVKNYQVDSNLRILFVNPNLRPGNATGKLLPVGLAYVMTVFKNAGLDYDLLDICLHDFTDEYVEAYFQEHSYDVVMLGSIVTHYKWMKWFVHMVKEQQPGCKIIVGNSVAGSIPSIWMDNTPTDYVVTGEGEWAALDIIQHLETGSPPEDILGITFRASDNSIIQNEKRPAVNVEDIPMIRWEDFDVAGYITFQESNPIGVPVDFANGDKIRTMPVSTARGCVFKCTFCHYVYWDDPYRHRRPEDILAECERNIDMYGANFIEFWDDLTFHSIRSAEKLVDAILESDVQFLWNAAIRADLFGNRKIEEERRISVAKKFRDSGCVNVGFSLESGNEEILKMMDKRVSVGDFDESVRILRLAGIAIDTSVVFGYPTETPETIQETFDQCARNELYPSVGVLLPLPYTEMYEYAKEHGYITDEDAYLTGITERQDICLNMTQMNDEKLLGLLKDGLEILNDQLDLGLDDLIRTGGERNHTKHVELPGEEEIMTRNENDFSFNYSAATFR